MPRADRRHAADPEGHDALNELVSVLSPGSGAASAPKGPGVQPALAAHRRHSVGQRINGRVSRSSRDIVGLRRVPPMTGPGRNYWRTLEELAETTEFAAAVEREVPRFRDVLGAFDRRRFLQLMAASMALSGLSACGPEPNPRQLLPYVEQPPGIVPGRSRYYATAIVAEGYATGVLVAHQMARPVQGRGQSRPSGEPRRGSRGRKRCHSGIGNARG
jgi:MoCo/4Fe-4S cofactor protein with predicted Tat translocation signal